MHGTSLENAVRFSKDAEFLKSIGLNFYATWALKALDVILERPDISPEFKKAVSFHKDEINHMSVANNIKTPIKELSEIVEKYHGDTRAAALCTLAKKDTEAFKDALNNCKINTNETKILKDNMMSYPVESVLNDTFSASCDYFDRMFFEREYNEPINEKIIIEPLVI